MYAHNNSFQHTAHTLLPTCHAPVHTFRQVFFDLRWYLAEIALLTGFIISSKLDNFLGFVANVTKNTVTMVTLAVMYDSLTPGV
jgi:hypothetical protein